MLKQFLSNSYLFGGNAPFVEELYEQYLANPGAGAGEWREYFDSMQVLPGGGDGKDVAHAPVIESFVQRAKSGQLRARPAARADADDRLQGAAPLLVTSYRISGARWATLDPPTRPPRSPAPALGPACYELADAH